MIRHRTTARGGLLLILSALLGLAVAISAGAASAGAASAGAASAGAASAGAASAGAAPKPGLVDGQPIVFPLIGDYAYTMNYGDPRGQGRHEGIDIEHVPWRTPVVAAESGTVKWWTTSWRAGCMLYLYGKSGTTYLYIHLNNDRTDASEDKGGCKAGVSYAVANGAKVTAGQQIAWSGDSGDAEGNYHLHFEVHPDDGAAVNPYPYLNAGERLLFPGKLGASYSLGLRGEPIAAGEGMLRLRATAVRWWPGGQWTSLVRDRVVTLGVTGDAEIDDSLVAALQGPAFETLRAPAPRTVTAFTARGVVSPAALRAKAGTLVAARITRPGGLTVAIGSTDETDPSAGVATDDPTGTGEQDSGLPYGA